MTDETTTSKKTNRLIGFIPEDQFLEITANLAATAKLAKAAKGKLAQIEKRFKEEGVVAKAQRSKAQKGIA